MDLQDPSIKMEKTNPSPAGVLFLLDPPDVLAQKVSRAVTDTESGPDAVRHDPAAKPGVSNLLDLLAACTGLDPRYAARGIDSYRELKSAVTETVVATLAPLQGVVRRDRLGRNGTGPRPGRRRRACARPRRAGGGQGGAGDGPQPVTADGDGVSSRMCPSPFTIHFVVVSSASPMGPRAWSFCVEMPSSAPGPNCPPSVNRVDALPSPRRSRSPRWSAPPQRGLR